MLTFFNKKPAEAAELTAEIYMLDLSAAVPVGTFSQKFFFVMSSRSPTLQNYETLRPVGLPDSIGFALLWLTAVKRMVLLKLEVSQI